MSVNKFKSTSVYGAFANKNRLDVSGNLVESCSATFEGQILYDDMSGNTINTDTLNVDTINCSDLISVYRLDATLEINSDVINANGTITGNVLSSSTSINGGTLNVTDVNTDNVNNVNIINMTTEQFIRTGTTGNLICSQPFQGTSYKKVVIFLDSFNGTNSFTYLTAFSKVPFITSSSSASYVTSLSTTSVTVTTASSTSTFIILEGF